jgi:hypothetical protein
MHLKKGKEMKIIKVSSCHHCPHRSFVRKAISDGTNRSEIMACGIEHREEYRDTDLFSVIDYPPWCPLGDDK